MDSGVDPGCGDADPRGRDPASLSEAEKRELEDLSTDLRDLVAEKGVPLANGADELLEALGLDRLRSDLTAAKMDPEAVVDLDTLWEAWALAPSYYAGHPLVDQEVFPAELVERWGELLVQHDLRPVRIYLRDVKVQT